MIDKAFYRTIRQSFKSAVIWAMVPMAAISGRSVSGCLSPSGQFDPNCRCAAIAGQAGSSASTCHCHCSCCAGKTCCCKSKSLAGGTKGGGLHDGSRCREIGFYAVATAVSAAKAANSCSDNQSTQPAALSADMPCSLAKIRGEYVAELNTGPPPERLIVALQHWVI